MSLPSHFMDELRRRTSLSQVIGRHVKLTKKVIGIPDSALFMVKKPVFPCP